MCKEKKEKEKSIKLSPSERWEIMSFAYSMAKKYPERKAFWEALYDKVLLTAKEMERY